MEAVDDYMANMLAYPGRTFGQLYHAFFRVNDLADGKIELSDHTIDLRACASRCWRSPAAATCSLRSRRSITSASCCENAASVQLETVPGGHLGALTGMSARDTTWPHLDDFLAANDVLADAA